MKKRTAPKKKTVTRTTKRATKTAAQNSADLGALVDDLKRRAVLQHDPVSADILTTHGLMPTTEEALKISAAL